MSVKTKISSTSTPSFFEFNPKFIPWQFRLIHDVNNRFDYSLGTHYVLMSGSVGSAKSVELAWLIIDHCRKYEGARVCIGRKALPDLKSTLYTKIIEMLYGSFEEKVDYWPTFETGYIKFANGSEIISRSWHDRKFKKFRSLELSMLAIEELTENDTRDWEFWNEAIARVERLPHIKENLVIAASNPDSPDHPAYKFFIEGSKRSATADYYASKTDEDGIENIHTYYSLTEHNPFLKASYIRNLRKRYDAKMIRRMLYGEWLYIATDVIYSEYDPDLHVKPDDELKLRKTLPIRLSFDFNIRKDKPMSSCLFQYNKNATNKSLRDKRFVFLDEVAVEGARTLSAMDEWQGKGWLDLEHNPTIIVHGDATGRRGDSRGMQSDYDIIEKYLANYRRRDGQSLNYVIDVPPNGMNPAVRDRHNITNGQLKNADGEVGIVIADKCEYIKAGFAGTRLKPNAGYLEDETTKGQDMSTAVTYGIHWCVTYDGNEELEAEFS